jgi:site-specific recombinase XerD
MNAGNKLLRNVFITRGNRGKAVIPVSNIKPLKEQNDDAPFSEALNDIIDSHVDYELDMERRKKPRARDSVNKKEALDLFFLTLNSKKTKKQYFMSVKDFAEWLNRKTEHNIFTAQRVDALRYLNEKKQFGEKHCLSFNWFVSCYRGPSSFYTSLETNYPDNYYTNIFRNHKIKFTEYDGEGGLSQKDVILVKKHEINTVRKELLLNKKYGIVYAIAFECMYTTGIRIGGINKYFSVKKEGNGNYRFFTISKGNPKYFGALSEGIVKKMIKAGLDLKRPFCGINYNSLRNVINEIKKKHKMEYSGGCHAFRRYAAFELYEKSDKDIVLVSRLLNHKNLTITSVYLQNIGLDVKLGGN